MKNFVNKILSALGDDMVPDNTKYYNLTPMTEIKKEDEMTELNLLTKVISAITYLYREDGMAPNVIVSALPGKKVYLSINRYDDKTDRYKKRIIFRSTRDTAEEVLMDAVNWLVNQKKDTTNPIDDLKELIKDTIKPIASKYTFGNKFGNENDL